MVLNFIFTVRPIDLKREKGKSIGNTAVLKRSQTMPSDVPSDCLMQPCYFTDIGECQKQIHKIGSSKKQ